MGDEVRGKRVFDTDLCCNIEGLWLSELRFGVTGSLTPISFLALVARSQLMPCPVALCNPVAQFCGSPDGLCGRPAPAWPRILGRFAP